MYECVCEGGKEREGEGRGGEGLKRVILTSNTYGHCHILTHLTKFGDNCKVNLTTTGLCKLY